MWFSISRVKFSFSLNVAVQRYAKIFNKQNLLSKVRDLNTNSKMFHASHSFYDSVLLPYVNLSKFKRNIYSRSQNKPKLRALLSLLMMKSISSTVSQACHCILPQNERISFVQAAPSRTRSEPPPEFLCVAGSAQTHIQEEEEQESRDGPAEEQLLEQREVIVTSSL